LIYISRVTDKSHSGFGFKSWNNASYNSFFAPSKNNKMHISLTIQSVLMHTFEVLIFAPLPLLILSAPFAYLKEWYKTTSHIRIIKRHYSNLELVGVEQLKQIFPHKGPDELEDIAGLLCQHNESYKY
jgi:hypothetical protein